MAKNKENLQKLLEFLDKSILHEPENKWFVDELCKRINQIGSGVNIKETKEKIEKIEKYLSLDYDLDSSSPIIDYSFISNELLRNKMISDGREMLRYRYGTRNHKIDFQEFCRYALLQAERLLNLYFSTKGDYQQVKEFILQFNPEAILPDKSSLETISFAVKLYTYQKAYNLELVYSIFDKVREIRNQQSHGSIKLKNNEKFFNEEWIKFKSQGYPLMPNGWINWNALQKLDPDKYRNYIENVKETPRHKKYIILAWERSQPFDEIMIALEVLAMHISKSLTL